MLDDWDRLLQAALSFAQRRLAGGPLAPFGATIGTDGALSAIGPEVGRLEPGGRTDQPAALYAAVRRVAADTRAAAFVQDVREGPNCLVRVELEHSSGDALTVLMRYTEAEGGWSVRYGDFDVEPGRPHVWGAS